MAKQVMSRWLSIQLCTVKQRLVISTSPSSSKPILATAERSVSTTAIATNKKKKRKEKKAAAEVVVVKKDKEKRRTRSEKEYEEFEFSNNENHVPVMLGEVVDVFSSLTLRSFVDCTLGAAGHSSAIIKSHPELECYIGTDVDPVALAKARVHLDALMHSHSNLIPHTIFKNFRHIKSVVAEVHNNNNLLRRGVDGILMDLGMSSMQVNDPQRGFTVLANGPLDMRMDPRAYDRQV